MSAKICPQPPRGITYMVGGESWLPLGKRTPRRLVCEEWGNLGPLGLDASIPPNAAGLRVRLTSYETPLWADDYDLVAGVYYWVRREGGANAR